MYVSWNVQDPQKILWILDSILMFEGTLTFDFLNSSFSYKKIGILQLWIKKGYFSQIPLGLMLFGPAGSAPSVRQCLCGTQNTHTSHHTNILAFWHQSDWFSKNNLGRKWRKLGPKWEFWTFSWNSQAMVA